MTIVVFDWIIQWQSTCRDSIYYVRLITLLLILLLDLIYYTL